MLTIAQSSHRWVTLKLLFRRPLFVFVVLLSELRLFVASSFNVLARWISLLQIEFLFLMLEAQVVKVIIHILRILNLFLINLKLSISAVLLIKVPPKFILITLRGTRLWFVPLFLIVTQLNIAAHLELFWALVGWRTRPFRVGVSILHYGFYGISRINFLLVIIVVILILIGLSLWVSRVVYLMVLVLIVGVRVLAVLNLCLFLLDESNQVVLVLGLILHFLISFQNLNISNLFYK